MTATHKPEEGTVRAALGKLGPKLASKPWAMAQV